MLRAFNVPETEIPASLHWAKVRVQNRDDGRYYQPEVGTNLITLQQLVEGRWKRHTRD
jgi:hypothetical protein